MYSKGDIVVINFPFSNLIESKKRPMIIVGKKGEDLIGCAITSNPESSGIPIKKFASGNLPFTSKIKYWQIHTFFKELVVKKIAKIDKKTYSDLVKEINNLIS